MGWHMKRKYIFKIFKVLIYSLICFLLIDLLLISGGQTSIIIKHYPSLIYLAFIGVILAGIWVMMTLLTLLFDGKIKKFFIFSCSLIVIIMVVKLTINFLEKKSLERVLSTIDMICSDKNPYHKVSIDESVEQDYKAFMTKCDVSKMRLYYWSVRKGRYDFIVETDTKKPFVITIGVQSNGDKELWIHDY